jgi:DNA replication protein DnaC
MEDSLKTLRKHLMELNLKHLANDVDQFIMENAQKETSNVQFFQNALMIEIIKRRQISIDKRLKYANLPVFDKAFDLNSFDFGKRQGVTKRQIIELTDNFLWIDKAYNVLFLGSSGLGKSYLASYLGYKAIEEGYSVIFVSMNNLAHLLRTEAVLMRSKAQMRRIRCCDLLILDEVGNAVLERQDANKVFQLICDFYQQTSLILTSNKSFSEWSHTLGDAVITTAVLDRILHKCEIFNIDGDSWRIEDQQSILKDLLKEGKRHARTNV